MRLPRGSLRIQLGAGAVAAVAALSSLGLAGVAYAADGGADLAVSVAGSTVVKEAGKPFLVRLHNNGPDPAVGIELTIDASGLDTSKLDFQLPDTSLGCVADGASKVRCALPDLPPGGNDNGIDLTGVHGIFVQSIGKSGAAGSFTVSVSAQTPDPNAKNNTVTTAVSVAKNGIDMQAWAQDAYTTLDSTEPIKPGKTGEFLWLLFNWGAQPVQGVEYTVTLPDYLSFANKHKECTYEQNDSVAHCSFPNVVIEPGGAIGDVDKQGNLAATKVKLAPNAPGPAVIDNGVVTGHGLAEVNPAAMRSLAKASTSDVAVLSAADAAKAKKPGKNKDADPNDNSAPFSAYTAANPADLSISATPAEGHVGDTVPVTLTVANAGPGDALDTVVKVTAPGGTEFTSVDPDCKAVTAGKEYTCEIGLAPAGAKGSGIFEVKILSATVTDGKAEVSSAAKDNNPGNNTAAIKVTVLTGGTGGGTGGGGGLPITGAQVGLISALGLGAIAVGAVLLVLTRRRRAVLVPPTD
jgi:Domain of unknown function DUF11